MADKPPEAAGEGASGQAHRGLHRLRQQLEHTRRLLKLCERERELIANELHDGCVQEMVAAHMFLEVALSSMKRRSPARQHVELALDRVRRAMTEARRVIGGIRLPTLEQYGLQGALEELVRDPRFAGIDIHLEIQLRRQRFVPTIELAVYRIVQEALNNVVKHSGATRVDIQLVEQPGQLRLQVRDNGRGFARRSGTGTGFGISSMQQRAKSLGGQCRVHSRPGKGTVVSATVPLRDRLLEA